MGVTSGKFTSIPSGVIVPVLKGQKLEAAFLMQAEFTSSDSDCADGEYRQYIRGEFTRNGEVVPVMLCPRSNTRLSKTDFREDGCPPPPPGCTAYGYRVCDGTKSKYTPTEAHGCTFNGADEPSISGTPGQKVGMDLYFNGQLKNTTTNKILAQANWQVKGEAVITHIILVTKTPAQALNGNYVSALVRQSTSGDRWEVAIVIARRPGGPVIRAREVQLSAWDAEGNALSIVSKPEGRLTEAGGSNTVTLSAPFQVEGGESDPARLKVDIQNESFTLHLTPEENNAS